MAKEDTERRIHVLPKELLHRVRAYQNANAIPSEVEAIRRLLNEALQMRDTVEDILQQLHAKWLEEKDLRVLNRDILSTHALIQTVHVTDRLLSFSLRNSDAGGIDRDGHLQKGYASDDGVPNLVDRVPERAKPQRSQLDTQKVAAAGTTPSSGGPDASSESDLDDEIPF